MANFSYKLLGTVALQPFCAHLIFSIFPIKSSLPNLSFSSRVSNSPMDSNGDRSQISLRLEFVVDGSEGLVKTNPYLTVEEFKLDVAHLTGIPSDRQILMFDGVYLENPRSLVTYEVKPYQTIQVLSRQPPGTSLSGGSTLAPGGTYILDEFTTCDQKPQIEVPTIPEFLRAIWNIPISDLMAQFPEIVQWVERLDPQSRTLLVKMSPLLLMFLGIQERLEAINTEGSDNPQKTGENRSTLGGSSNPVYKPVSLHDDKLLQPFWRYLHELQKDPDFMPDRASRDDTEERLTLEAIEKYFASELKVMQEQGFMDTAKNVRALLESGDDVQKAIEKLKEKPN